MFGLERKMLFGKSCLPNIHFCEFTRYFGKIFKFFISHPPFYYLIKGEFLHAFLWLK